MYRVLCDSLAGTPEFIVPAANSLPPCLPDETRQCLARCRVASRTGNALLSIRHGRQIDRKSLPLRLEPRNFSYERASVSRLRFFFREEGEMERGRDSTGS
jgi:hypothetical protein